MKPLSILVVDDMSETLEVIASCLRTVGHSVACAIGGNRAIELLQNGTFDMIITDVLMPDADGMEVIMAARQAAPSAHIIVMTGGGDFFCAEELLKLGSKLGADQQLAKPFSRTQLLAAVERHGCESPTMVGVA